jgi:GNAT superfamily N-acetyltransferase
MSCEVRERDFASFWEVPWQVYPSSYPGAQPMRGDLEKMVDGGRNPVFDGPDRVTFFTVVRNGSPVGRVTAHVHDRANRHLGLRRGYFGFLDVADDRDAASTLLDAACGWLRDRGCNEVMGNVNMTAMQQMGIVTHGFEHAPYVDQAYNAPHIPELLERLGFERTFPMRTLELDVQSARPVLSDAMRRRLTASDEVSCRPVRRRGLERSMDVCRRILNETFSENPLFVPLSPAEFEAQAEGLTWILDERLSSVWTRGERSVGVLVCIPDLNPLLRATRSRLGLSAPWHLLRHRRRRRRAIILFGGVVKEERGKGLGALMLDRTLTALRSGGYETLSFTWIGDDNRASLSQVRRLGARRMHRVHLYRRSL